ncbi:ABC transporter permease [Caldalkalibacillus mannanilyticus]|uniref:ABC transporter permease n=1 Tax=Caldalkalibacillus mannanilyticus TaxID=1418 RepID=UPI000684F73D|nr:ABC transporter permease [Caldalkalibacillus mannanilyticus]
MSNFFKLVANENMKIYRRPRTWCLIFITILITITYGIIINYNSNKEMNWEVEIAQQIEINKHYLEDDSWKGGLEKQFEREIILAQYALDHQNYANYERSLWTGVKESEWILFFVILFTILIAAGIVAEEFTKGTIKLLLIRPVSRFKILLSKYVSTFLFAGILLIAVFLVAVLTNSFYHGFGDFGHQYLYLDHQMNVVEGSMFLKTIEVFYGT